MRGCKKRHRSKPVWKPTQPPELAKSIWRARMKPICHFPEYTRPRRIYWKARSSLSKWISQEHFACFYTGGSAGQGSGRVQRPHEFGFEKLWLSISENQNQKIVISLSHSGYWKKKSVFWFAIALAYLLSAGEIDLILREKYFWRAHNILYIPSASAASSERQYSFDRWRACAVEV